MTTAHHAADRWVRTWGASPQLPDAAIAGLEPFADVTLRQEVRISGGGRRVRIRFTNEYGTAGLTIGAARVGLAAPAGGVRPGSDRVLTFDGRPTVTVPPGAPMLSDPVDLRLPPLAQLSLSLYLPEPVKTCTCHGMGVQTCWTVPGNAVAIPGRPAHATSLPLQAFLSAVEVIPEGPAKTIVAVGDSLTDGFGSTPDTNRRWTDRLAERLIEHGGAAVHVSNQGISGNRMLNDGFGVSTLARFDRDVLATPGLGYVIVSEGLGDIAVSFAPREDDGPLAEFLKTFPGSPITAEDIIAGYGQLIARAHGHGVKIYAATLTPYENDDMFAPEGESARQVVNTWIRTSGAFDGVLDFDAVWRDPADPRRIKDGFHAGDVHGSDAGYRALAGSIDLSLFE
ncbi:SGNH/GDSL hydrolase family protein [Amycolatopsis pigmentata]|uniref:SGNH/GDSL hydrolase family protein n=1 Tax=Amycolatopsis pigmentata TaxID=450801 RepID=A0ABW5FM04_9PSEU